MNKVNIIAEIGINFDGNLNLAHSMIRESAIAGANYAKFQIYSPKKLFLENILTRNEEIYKNVKHTELHKNDVEQLIKWCDEEGINFLASVFDSERFGWLEDLGIETYKIASRTAKFDRDLSHRILDTGKKCFVSLGFEAETFSSEYKNVEYLYCVAKYPTEYKDLNLPISFKDSIYSGVSLHDIGIESALVAIGRGATVVEKHVTYSRSNTSPKYDHICSITFDELAELVKYSKLMAKIIK